jgi:DNA-binding GntR family transcriptional regulator
MPVREALQRLVAERALMQMPNRTFRVTPFSAEMFRELVRVRMTVEGFAATEAARHATGKKLQQLSRLNAQMIHSLEAGEPTKVITANREFHFTLYEMTEMPQLLDIINGLWLRVGPYLTYLSQLFGTIPWWNLVPNGPFISG